MYRYLFCIFGSEAPIYMGPEQHLICCGCWERVTASARRECAICRAPYPRTAKRHRYLERAAEELQELRLKQQAMLNKK